MAGALWEGGSRPGPSPRGCAAEVRRARTRGKEGTRRSWSPVRSGRPGPRMASPGGRPNAGGPAKGSRSRPPAAAHLLRLAPTTLAAAPPPPSSQFTACSPRPRPERHVNLAQTGPSSLLWRGCRTARSAPLRDFQKDSVTPLLSSGLCLWEPLGPGALGHERTFPLFIPPQRRSWHQPLGGLCSPPPHGAWEQPPATLLSHTPLCPLLSMPTFSSFQSSISAVPLTGGRTSGGLVLGFFWGGHSLGGHSGLWQGPWE